MRNQKSAEYHLYEHFKRQTVKIAQGKTLTRQRKANLKRALIWFGFFV